jgi:hypothetical protein
MAPRGDSSVVLAIFPFIFHGGDNGTPRPGVGVVTDENFWLIPHYLGQLEDDPRSTIFIHSIPWRLVDGWDHRKPIWGQQLFSVSHFTQEVDLSDDYSEAIRQNRRRREGLLFWERRDHEYVIQLIKKMITEKGAFDPSSRLETF